jgi:hypothetical protein
MLNWNTMGIVTTRDIIWLGRMYFSKLENDLIPSIDLCDDVEEEECDNQQIEINREDEGWQTVIRGASQNNSNIANNVPTPQLSS